MLLQSLPARHRSSAAKGQLGATAHDPLPSQKVSHAHELEQSMPAAQLLLPSHSTLQRPAPHVTAPAHDPLPRQSMSHSVAALQSMAPPHAEAPQLTAQV